MQQIFVEMYSYKDEWRHLDPGSRERFGSDVLASCLELGRHGIEVLGYAFNDPDTDSRAPYDFFCVYRSPDRDAQRGFERQIRDAGWYRYFEQVNLRGAALTPLGLLPTHAGLAEPTAQPEPISPTQPYCKGYAQSHGRTMAYLDEGRGRAVVLVHGDVMSSYLWRNVLPHLDGLGRLIAVDLIGAGDSDKLPGSGPDSYGFAEHAHYLDGLLDSLDVGDDVVLVGHDWGANLAVDWAMRHPGRVAGIAMNEALLPPFDWSDWPEALRPGFEFLRSPAGEQAVLQDNFFLSSMPANVLRALSAAELTEITRPYAEPGEARRPTLSWPREVPFGDDDTPTRAALERQAQWLSRSPVPKLHLQSVPGGVTPVDGRRSAAIRTWPALTEARVSGAHWAPEEDPHSIGRALARWLGALRPTGAPA